MSRQTRQDVAPTEKKHTSNQLHWKGGKQIAEGSRSITANGCAYAASLATAKDLPRDDCGGVLREGRVFYATQRHPFPVQFAEGLRARVIGQGRVVTG